MRSLVPIVSLALSALPAQADEGGVPFWFSGQYASFAAMPVSPGFSMPIQGYYYTGGASRSKTLDRGNVASAGLDSSVPLLMVQPTWAPKTKILGGQAAFGLGFGWGNNTTDASLAVTGFDREAGRSDSLTGFTDLYPIASIAWTKGNSNWMGYVTGDIPTADYDPDRLSNIGIGHGAVDAGGGYTFFDPTSGWEASAVAGLTWNMENPDTDYRNGVDIHLDWAASRYITEKWQIGLAGYLYGQLTDDSGAGAPDNYRSSIAAIGPEIGYSFSVSGQPAYFNLRAYHEFAARNRVEGTAVFATLSLPIGQLLK